MLTEFVKDKEPTEQTRKAFLETGLLNPEVWFPGDLSMIPRWSSQTGPCFLGCLVTPLHLVSCSHAQTGGRIDFATCSRDIVNKKSIGHDITVYKLDKPALGCNPVPILGPSKPLRGIKLPLCFWKNQDQELVLCRIRVITANTIMVDTLTKEFPGWYEKPRGGDSGSSIFIEINRQPILVSHFTHSADGPAIGTWVTKINEAIKTMGSGGYQVSIYGG